MKKDIFYKYQGIKLSHFTRAKRELLATTPKILVVICNASDERFRLLYEDMEVRNTTFAGNKIMQNKRTILNSQAWGIDYITDQTAVQKLGKQIKFICNHLRDLPALHNLNAMEDEDRYVQLMEYALQYYDVKMY